MALYNCVGNITGNLAGQIKCTSGPFTVLTPADLVVVLAQYQITATNILYVLTWGMGVVLLMWSLGYAIGVAKSVIAKL